MQRDRIHIFMAALMAMAVLSGCKKVDFDTRLIIRPRVMRVQSSQAGGEPAYMTRVYAYYIAKNEMTDFWEVSSYENAAGGIINKVGDTQTQRIYDFVAEQPSIESEPTEEQTYLHLVLSRSYVFLVVVNDDDKFYAYRSLEIPTPLSTMLIPVRFLLYRPEVRYKESSWWVVNATLEAGQTKAEQGESKEARGEEQ